MVWEVLEVEVEVGWMAQYWHTIHSWIHKHEYNLGIDSVVDSTRAYKVPLTGIDQSAY